MRPQDAVRLKAEAEAGILKSMEMNMRWMEKGARKGTPDSMYRLGVMCLEPVPGGTHNPYFLNSDYYAKETSEKIQASVKEYLGL